MCSRYLMATRGGSGVDRQCAQTSRRTVSGRSLDTLREPWLPVRMLSFTHTATGVWPSVTSNEAGIGSIPWTDEVEAIISLRRICFMKPRGDVLIRL
jgi:hypothetical protein